LYSQHERGRGWTKYRSPRRKPGAPGNGAANTIPIDPKYDKLRIIAIDLDNRQSKVHDFP